MSVKKITKGDFAGFVEALIKTEKVIGIQAKGDRFDFAPLGVGAKDLRLDYDVTLQPPGEGLPAADGGADDVRGGGRVQVADDARSSSCWACIPTT